MSEEQDRTYHQWLAALAVIRHDFTAYLRHNALNLTPAQINSADYFLTREKRWADDRLRQGGSQNRGFRDTWRPSSKTNAVLIPTGRTRDLHTRGPS